MEEIWKEIEGFDGRYLVSTFGRVYSRYSKKFLSVWKSKTGYVLVRIQFKGVSKNYLIHRLVAMAFIPNNNNLVEVNHKDENKSNNNVENLEWCDRKYNQNYNKDKLRRFIFSGAQGNKIASSKRVAKINKNGVIEKIYLGTREAERDGYSHQAIGKVCNGKQKTHKGFVWKYV